MARSIPATINLYIDRILPRAIKYKSSTYSLLFTPLLAIVLFTMAMTLIIWNLNYQNKSQQEYTLYRETAYAKQRIQNRFLNNEEKLLELSREIINSVNQMRYPDAMLKSATRLIQDSPEILHIRWIDREQNRLWSIPVNASAREWFDRRGSQKKSLIKN